MIMIAVCDCCWIGTRIFPPPPGGNFAKLSGSHHFGIKQLWAQATLGSNHFGLKPTLKSHSQRAWIGIVVFPSSPRWGPGISDAPPHFMIAHLVWSIAESLSPKVCMAITNRTSPSPVGCFRICSSRSAPSTFRRRLSRAMPYKYHRRPASCGLPYLNRRIQLNPQGALPHRDLNYCATYDKRPLAPNLYSSAWCR